MDLKDTFSIVKCALPYSVRFVLNIEVVEGLECHIGSALQAFKKCGFPLLCFSLELEATLLFLVLCPCVVGVVEFAEPCFS